MTRPGRRSAARPTEILGNRYYDRPDLQNYVAQVGQRVVAAADARFHFQFKVVDQPIVNAMALPGGFIYVARGMLAQLNDEAQLAGILGHEITHVNSRHGAKLLTKAFGAQLAPHRHWAGPPAVPAAPSAAWP
jgi:predicted Zn-dependent protease